MKTMRFARLMALVLPLLLLACSDSDNNDNVQPTPKPEPEKLTFQLTLGEPEVSSVSLAVVPSDKEALYYFDLLDKSVLESSHEGSLERYMENLVATVVAEQGGIEAALERIASQGDEQYTFTQLSPDTEYVAFAVGLDNEGKVNSEVESQAVRTKAMPEVCSWEVTFDEMHYDGLSFTITPSNDEVYYYFTVRPQASYSQQMTDAELLEAILMEDGMMIDYYAVSGVYESLYEMQEFICCADTGYDLLVFGYADGQALTSIKKFPFRTLKSESPATACTFTITVSEQTANGAKVVVTPSDLYQMYLWDVVDQKELSNDYEGNIQRYVEAYIANTIEIMGLYEIDFVRVMGEDQYTFNLEMEPATEYVVWSCCVDEYGRISSPIQTESFQTTAE